MATVSFQGHAMYWWTSLVWDKRIHNESQVRYWNEVKNAL